MSTIATVQRTRRRNTLMCLIVIAALCAGIALEGMKLRRDLAFNAALDDGQAAAAAGHPGAHGKFALAYARQNDGDLDGALGTYGQLSEAEQHNVGVGTDLGERLRYNLSTLYLQKAVEAADEQSDQTRLPLVELAKQGFRDVLRENPQHWPSRYNLTRAIALVPDLLEFSAEEDRMPERSPRAPQEARAHDRLP